MTHRYNVEPCPYGAGFYVRDAQERCIAHGPWPTQAQCAYECDRLRKPLYHDGAPRKPWGALRDYEQDTWRRNPTPRVWRAPIPI